MGPLKRKDVMTLAEVTAKAERQPLVAKLAGSISGKQERKSARGNRFAFVQLSDPTGLYEVTVFSDTLEAARDVIEPGTNVVLTVEANMEADQLKLLARSIVPIDTIAAGAGGLALKIHIDEISAVASVQSVLQRMADGKGARGKGQITFCIADRDTGQGGGRDSRAGFSANTADQERIQKLAGRGACRGYLTNEIGSRKLIGVTFGTSRQ